MNFKNFIKLDEIVKQVDTKFGAATKAAAKEKMYQAVDDVRKLFETDYSEAFNISTKLWRRSSAVSHFKIFNSDKFITDRHEKGFKPFSWDKMQIINSEWKKFPNRSKSVMFTNSYDHTLLFNGETHRIFPKNSATIAASETDYNFFHYWPSIKKYLINKSDQQFSSFTNDFNLFVDQITSLVFDEDKFFQFYVSRKTTKLFVENKEEIFKKIKTLPTTKKLTVQIEKKFEKSKISSHYLENLTRSNIFLKILTDDFNNDLEKMFEEFFSPSKNGFKIISVKEIDNFIKDEDNAYEFWTTDNCLIVNPFILAGLT